MLALSRFPSAPEFRAPAPKYSPLPSPAASPMTPNFSRLDREQLPAQTLPKPHQYFPQRPVPSLIERLPNEVKGMVFSHLDYQSLIFLSSTNRYLHQLVIPQRLADPADMFQFVMRAAKDFPQHRPREKGQEHHPGNFECYTCYRVRSPDHFDMLQPLTVFVDMGGRIVRDREPCPRTDREIALRRFCIECGVREGLHVPMDCLTTRTGRELWVCRCRRVWSKPGCLRCPDCGGDCPLRPRRK